MYNLNMRAEFIVLGNRKSARVLRTFTEQKLNVNFILG